MRLPVISSLLFVSTLLLPSASFRLHAEAKTPSSIAWTENYKEASALAKKENKPIFLFFTGSDWCPWCKRIDKEILTTADFANLLTGELVFVKADFPQNIPQDPSLEVQNEELKTTFGIKGFPTIVLPDPNGKEIGRMGYEKGGGKAFADKVQKKLRDYFANKAKKA